MTWPEEYKAFHSKRLAMMVGLLERNVTGALGRSLDIGGGGDILDLSTVVRDRFGAETHSVDLGEDVELGLKKGLLSRECNIDEEPLPFEDGYFDLVIFASVLEHLYNPRFALDEVGRIVKPGGLLLLETPNAVAAARRIDALRGRNPFVWFNEYNAEKNKSRMVHCSVLYTTGEVERLLARDFTMGDRAYAMHMPSCNAFKALVRWAVSAFFPGMSDSFAVVARRRGAQ